MAQVANNQLTGTIPQQFADGLPDSLQNLVLIKNRLGGPLPSPWIFPSSLLMLGLSECLFDGTIPGDWQLPPSTSSIFLASNAGLGGTLPSWNLPNLTYAYFSLCQLSGEHCCRGDSYATARFSARIFDSNHHALVPHSSCLRAHAGTLPAWQAPETAQVWVLPQASGPGFCGEVSKPCIVSSTSRVS